jgi:hypothetical protein
MLITHQDDAMQTVIDTEIEFRRDRLLAEAANERLAGSRDGPRQALGHALMSLGLRVHGPEPRDASRHHLHAHRA